MATISIIRVENPEKKAEISAHILHALPDWFGLPDSTQISRVISAARFFRSLRRTCRRRCTGAKMIARMVPQNTAP